MRCSLSAGAAGKTAARIVLQLARAGYKVTAGTLRTVTIKQLQVCMSVVATLPVCLVSSVVYLISNSVCTC